MRSSKLPWSFLLVLSVLTVHHSEARAGDPWVVYEGGDGPGKGKHIVLVSGDEEYRSEEACPMLGKLLAKRHGFKCTVLFSINPENGTIDPTNQTHIPGIEALADADMMIVFLRFRELPDEKMKYFVDFVNSGKPILGLRTATHAFNYRRNKNSPYANYSYNSRQWKGGFGQQVLGDTWISHHGHHKFESTRGVINSKYADHPILNSVKDIWGPSDVYGIRNLTPDAKVLVHGQVLKGMKPSDPPLAGKKNDPMMPLFWVKEYKGEKGKVSRVICTTMGASVDLQNEGLRRLVVNSCFWGLELPVPKKANVQFVGSYKPTFYGFNTYQRGVKPSAHELD